MPPAMTPMEALRAGEVGYIAASIKDMRDTRVGDTITDARTPAAETAARLQAGAPDGVTAAFIRRTARITRASSDALEKLQLNDASLSYEPGNVRGARLWLPLRLSGAAAHGNHSGAAGTRIRSRPGYDRAERHLSRYTRPTARRWTCDNPTNLPPVSEIEHMEEPFVRGAASITPQEYVGALMEVCQNKRGVFKDMKSIEGQRVLPALRNAAERNHLRFLRPDQEPHAAATRQLRLRAVRLSAERSGEAGYPAERRPVRRALHDRAPRPGVCAAAAPSRKS